MRPIKATPNDAPNYIASQLKRIRLVLYLAAIHPTAKAPSAWAFLQPKFVIRDIKQPIWLNIMVVLGCVIYIFYETISDHNTSFAYIPWIVTIVVSLLLTRHIVLSIKGEVLLLKKLVTNVEIQDEIVHLTLSKLIPFKGGLFKVESYELRNALMNLSMVNRLDKEFGNVIDFMDSEKVVCTIILKYIEDEDNLKDSLNDVQPLT